ncbi:6306_t:CDS:2, partial [Dentiscutata heterogama]
LKEEDFVCSNLLSTAAANNYLKVYNKKKTKYLNQISKSSINSVYLFGLQLKQLRHIRKKHREKRHKLFANLSNKIQVIQNKNI